jgi:hypothetical protein
LAEADKNQSRLKKLIVKTLAAAKHPAAATVMARGEQKAVADNGKSGVWKNTGAPKQSYHPLR